jgi:hypothetical protein
MDDRPFRRYLRLLIALIFVPAIAWCALEIGLDPYRVFGLSDFNRRNFEPNTRYLKIHYLAAEPGRLGGYQGFILGTSRANFYRVETAGALTGQRFYNLNVSAETIEGMYRKLRWLMANGNPKTVVAALDYDVQFLGIYRYDDPDDLLRLDHPLVSGMSRLDFYPDYLFTGAKSLRRVVRGNLFTKRTQYVLDVSTGHGAAPAWDEEMRADPGKFAERIKPAPKESGRMPPDDDAFEYLGKLAALAAGSGIDLVFVVNPISHDLFDSFDAADYLAWEDRLAALDTPVWDFSGHNELTDNDRNYYEARHFTAAVGDLVLRQVLVRDGSGVGVRLTPGVVAARRQTLRSAGILPND